MLDNIVEPFIIRAPGLTLVQEYRQVKVYVPKSETVTVAFGATLSGVNTADPGPELIFHEPMPLLSVAFNLYIPISTSSSYIPKKVIYPPEPDLECNGSLIFYDVKPGSTVYNTFQIMNVGDPGSNLNWEIYSWPTWGAFTFTPRQGNGLKPEDGPVTINVTVVFPSEHQNNFTGEVRVVNRDNVSDFDIVPVMLGYPGPSVRITKPYRAIFKDNEAIFPFIVPVIIGNIDIKVTSTAAIWQVGFYVDGALQYTDTTEPFIWTWNESKSFSRHKIETYVYGRGYCNIAAMNVWKLR